MMKRHAGLTLIELMVVVALIGVVLTLAGPAFNNMILMQRLRGATAELVTDLQLARSEAVAKRNYVRVRFQTGNDSNMVDSTCYVIYTAPVSGPTTDCDCLAAPASICPSGFAEIKTVLLPRSRGVLVEAVPRNVSGWEPKFAIDWRTGGLFSSPSDNDPIAISRYFISTSIDSARKLHIQVNAAGRPTVCSPTGSTMTEAACT